MKERRREEMKKGSQGRKEGRSQGEMVRKELNYFSAGRKIRSLRRKEGCR